ncbi:MAG: thiol-disulfide isomerase/thioredoxin [Bradymonadia bacterium]|jgi:thiol-disulfide isomerase/thioredoxin
MLTAAFAMFCYASPAEAQVEFRDSSFSEALAAAQSTDSVVLVDVYATWCGPCQRLDEEVFSTPALAEATADVIALKIDAESGEGPALVERYHVVGYPTILVLTPDGIEIDRIFGFMNTTDFVETLAGYREGRGTITELALAVAMDPTNIALVSELASRNTIRGELVDAERLFAAVIAADANNTQGLASHAYYWLGKYGYLRGASDPARAIAQFAEVIERYPDADEVLGALIQSGIAAMRMEQDEQAQAFFESAIAAAPEQPELYNSIAFTVFHENRMLHWGISTAHRGLVIDPDNAGLLDTLAELHASAGDVEAALVAIELAVEAAPGETYYQTQRAKFQLMRDTRPREGDEGNGP